ncbi:alpha/beta fold hydrolase [Devosia sp. ZB163]|uniref:alpha/beta hydrolase n=1 Tax=Devosia sp. ZB163 TaxID=3025938 RepID=UPI00235ED92D|nr:alpha/beta fold hydrolase [Devosia sp. ZB163]MDC9824798.1 alpha/beta fold hydrolase [Devosia sp. ZB163]
MNEWVRWIGIGVVVLVAVYVAAGAIGTSAVLNHLLTPGGVDWAGYNNPDPPQDPFELGYRGDPQAALGLPFETVSIDTELGPAEAWFVPAANMDGPWAVYVHGIGGIRENGYRQLAILHEADVPTLMITYRNDRGAPGEERALYSFGMNEWRDVDAAVGWMVDRGAPGIILVAESMGGAIAGQFLMHSEKADKVVALALDAPALDFVELVADKLGARALPFAHTLASAGVAVFDAYRGASLSGAVSLGAVADFPGPLFLAHGATDSLVPVTISDRLAAKRTAPTTYVRTNAQHLRSFKENPERYRGEMLGWLNSLGG